MTNHLLHAKLLLVGGMLIGSSAANADVIYQQDFENWSNAQGLWSSQVVADLGGPYTKVLGRYGTDRVTLNLLATEANSSGGGQPSGGPHDVTLNWFHDNDFSEPIPEGSGGGGWAGSGNNGNLDGPTIDFGDLNTGGDNGGNSGPPMFVAGTYAVHFDLMQFDSWDGYNTPHGMDSFAVEINGERVFDEFLFVGTLDRNFRLPDETPSQNVYNPNWADHIYRDIVLLVELSDPTDRLQIDFIGSLSQSLADESWGIDNILVERVVSGSAVPAPGVLSLFGAGLGLVSRRKR